MVLEEGERGPMLCLGAILDSLPPQCGDVPIENWEWDRVNGEARQADTIWGHYYVRGTFDGTTFVVIDAGPPRKGRGSESDPIGTPCEEPPGGWQTTVPDLAGRGDVNRANAAVKTDPEFAGLWIEYLDEQMDSAAEDPSDILLNVAFTANLERHEQELREHWGGPLCVIRHDRSHTRLEQIESELSGEVGRNLGLQPLFSSLDVENNVVELEVVAIDERIREAVGRRYGKDAVRITAALHRVR